MCKKCECFSFNSYQNSVNHRALQAKLCPSLSCRLAWAFVSECRAQLLSSTTLLETGAVRRNGDIKQPFSAELFRVANPEICESIMQLKIGTCCVLQPKIVAIVEAGYFNIHKCKSFQHARWTHALPCSIIHSVLNRHEAKSSPAINECIHYWDQ